MNDLRRFAFLAVTAMMAVALPCVAQEQQNTQATPDFSGSGHAKYIPVWTSKTNLGTSAIYATGGEIGIGTTTPAATLEVNGNAQVDGNLSLSGSIMLTGVGQLLWAGGSNLGAGLGALPSATTGNQNAAVGFSALASNTTGYGNTATGSNALASNNIGLFNTGTGVQSLGNNTTGGANVANGAFALGVNITGNNNTASGDSALASNTSGSHNIALGWSAGFNITTTSNNIEIGNPGTVTDSGVIRIGCQGISCFTGPNTSAFIAGIYGSSTGLANVGVVVDANGNLGTVQSSRRYKQDIQDMADASDGLMQLRPVTFRYKKAYEDGSKPVQYGLIAEEVADVYPDLVARSADGQIESVRYQLLDPMLLNELQKQHATIDAQKEQIRSLEERLARIEAMLAAGVTGATGQ